MQLAADRLPTLAVVGESHADPMHSALVRDEATGENLAVAAYAHIPALRSEYYLDAHGRINGKIVAALCALRLLLYCEAHHPDVISPAIMERNLYNPQGGDGWRIHAALKDTPLLFVSGEVDARSVLRVIPPYADVPVPFDAAALARVPTFTATASVTEDSLTTSIAAVLAPLFRAIELLRAVGFSNIALHSISPPTADDAAYLREINHDSRALTRYKVVMLFNAALSAYCRTNAFVFIDRWDDFTSGGLVRDGYGADAVHVKDVYMRESLGRLYDATIGRAVRV